MLSHKPYQIQNQKGMCPLFHALITTFSLVRRVYRLLGFHEPHHTRCTQSTNKPDYSNAAYSLSFSSNHSYNIAWNDLKALKRKKTNDSLPTPSSPVLPTDQLLQIFEHPAKKSAPSALEPVETVVPVAAVAAVVEPSWSGQQAEELYVELTEEDLLRIEQVENCTTTTNNDSIEGNSGSAGGTQDVCVVSAEELELYAELERQAMGVDVSPPLLPPPVPRLVYRLRISAGGVKYAERGGGVLLITTEVGEGTVEGQGELVYVELLESW